MHARKCLHTFNFTKLIESIMGAANAISGKQVSCTLTHYLTLSCCYSVKLIWLLTSTFSQADLLLLLSGAKTSQNLLTDKWKRTLENTDMNLPRCHYQGDLCILVPPEQNSFQLRVYLKATKLLVYSVAQTVTDRQQQNSFRTTWPCN